MIDLKRFAPSHGPRYSAAPRGLLAAGVLVLAIVALFAPGREASRADTKPAASTPSAESPKQEASRLLQENEILARRIDLAGSDAFYLLLDPSASRLKLMLQGATLQDYPVLGLEIGRPRVFFRRRTLPEGWQGRIWDKGALDPPRERERKEIVIETIGDTLAADSITTALGIPKTPEEAYPVPTRYHVRYEGGLSIEVRLPAVSDSIGVVQNTFPRRMSAWWSDVKSALRAEVGDRVRLRVILSKDDAKSLYRALPPDTKLLILPNS